MKKSNWCVPFIALLLSAVMLFANSMQTQAHHGGSRTQRIVSAEGGSESTTVPVPRSSHGSHHADEACPVNPTCPINQRSSDHNTACPSGHSAGGYCQTGCSLDHEHQYCDYCSTVSGNSVTVSGNSTGAGGR